MTKKEEKRIAKLLEAFDWMFGVQNFEKHLNVSKEPNKNPDIIADISQDEDYQRVYITLYPGFFEQKPEAQRKALLHEMCHTITLPSKSLAIDLRDGKLVTQDHIDWINERETTKIENLMNDLLRNHLSYARKAYQNYVKTEIKNKPKTKKVKAK